MEKSNYWLLQASLTKDMNLKKFYYNASVGFKDKALKLKISEA